MFILQKHLRTDGNIKNKTFIIQPTPSGVMVKEHPIGVWKVGRSNTVQFIPKTSKMVHATSLLDASRLKGQSMDYQPQVGNTSAHIDWPNSLLLQ